MKALKNLQVLHYRLRHGRNSKKLRDTEKCSDSNALSEGIQYRV